MNPSAKRTEIEDGAYMSLSCCDNPPMHKSTRFRWDGPYSISTVKHKCLSCGSMFETTQRKYVGETAAQRGARLGRPGYE